MDTLFIAAANSDLFIWLVSSIHSAPAYTQRFLFGLVGMAIVGIPCLMGVGILAGILAAQSKWREYHRLHWGIPRELTAAKKRNLEAARRIAEARRSVTGYGV
jgi:hypothetical protein